MVGRIVRVVLIGAHVSSSGGIHTAIDRAEAIGAESVQVFTQSPRAWRPTNHPPENLERFKERRAEAGIGGVLCHALYLVNLASPKDEIYEKSVEAVCNTVDVGVAIEADGVVFHIGSHLGAGMDVGLDRVCEAMKKVLDHCSEATWLLMENSAGAGGTIGRSIEELALVFDRLDGHPRLGVCLDSCHLYVSGCDVTDEAALDSLLDELDGSIGLERLRALHVNDSKAPLGSNLDRHDNVGEGLMGERLGVFLGHPKVQGLPAVLEVPGPDGHGPEATQIETTKELHARWAAKVRSSPAGSGRGPPSDSSLVRKRARVCNAVVPKVRQRKKRF
jgi:deoxyribonuclease-4